MAAEVDGDHVIVMVRSTVAQNVQEVISAVRTVTPMSAQVCKYVGKFTCRRNTHMLRYS